MPAFAGAHASGRAGQHLDEKKVVAVVYYSTFLKFELMPRVKFEHEIVKVYLDRSKTYKQKQASVGKTNSVIQRAAK